jgi:sugar lactone lactonase YvrE
MSIYRKTLIGLIAGAALVLCAAPGHRARALPANDIADHVFGQNGSFVTGGCNLGGGVVNASSLCLANQGDAVFDAAGNLYVADTNNNRVLEYDTPLTGDKIADRVFGQAGSFTSNACNLANPTASTLCLPTDVALDAAGNLYVVDANNNRVLEYNAPLTDSVADEVFGQEGSFTARVCNNFGLNADSLCFDGDGSGARGGVAVDASGNVWVADFSNHRVLVYSTPLATDTTADVVFGQAGDFTTAVCDNGGISANSLCNPAAVALDGGGNLYVADADNNRVLEYNTPLTTNTTADRVFGQGGAFFTDVCNNGGTSASSLCLTNLRAGIALDTQGNLFVTDQANSRVLEYEAPLTTDLIADRVFGTSGSFVDAGCNLGGQSAGSLCGAAGLAVDGAGNLAVADAGNNRIVVYADSLRPGVPADVVFGHGGVFTSSACDDGGINASSLCMNGNQGGVAVDAAGNVYVADYMKNRILGYNSPLTTDTVADRVFGQNGDFTTGLCNLGGFIGANSLCRPSGLAVDAAGNLYAVDAGNNRVLVYNTPLTTDTVADLVFGQNGNFVTTGCNASSASSLCFSGGTPARGDVALDPAGNLYIAEYGAFRVLEYDTPLVSGVVADRVFGQNGSFGASICNLGGVSASSLCLPSGVAVDSAGNLYVVDSANQRVLEYHTPLSTDTVADTVFGQAGDFTTSTCDKGGLSAASLCFGLFANDWRGDVAVDGVGNVFIAEGPRSRVLEYDTPLSSGVVADRVYGHAAHNYPTGSCNDGDVTREALCAPLGVALGPDRSLFVLDAFNNRVLAFVAGTDVDEDGCSDVEELGDDELAGGRRDPDNRWDFYDVNGSHKVDAIDIGMVRSHFNQGTGHAMYAAVFDRSAGAAGWAPGPPDGIVNAADIGLVRAAFNHNCQLPPVAGGRWAPWRGPCRPRTMRAQCRAGVLQAIHRAAVSPRPDAHSNWIDAITGSMNCRRSGKKSGFSPPPTISTISPSIVSSTTWMRSRENMPKSSNKWTNSSSTSVATSICRPATPPIVTSDGPDCTMTRGCVASQSTKLDGRGSMLLSSAGSLSSSGVYTET